MTWWAIVLAGVWYITYLTFKVLDYRAAKAYTSLHDCIDYIMLEGDNTSCSCEPPDRETI